MSAARFVAFALPLLLLAAVSVAAPLDPIVWSSVDGGGLFRTGGATYQLSGTVGQPDAGVHAGGGYTLRGGFWHGGGAATLDAPPNAGAPIAFRFLAPAPNPSRGASRVSFVVPSAAEARLRVFDVSGRCVRRADFGRLAPGRHDRTWNGDDDAGRPLPGGVYFLRLEVGAQQGVRRVLVLR